MLELFPSMVTVASNSVSTAGVLRVQFREFAGVKLGDRLRDGLRGRLVHGNPRLPQAAHRATTNSADDHGVDCPTRQRLQRIARAVNMMLIVIDQRFHRQCF